MNKEWLDQVDKIEVPKEEVNAVIAKAIAAGKNQKQKRKRKTIKSSIFISSAAASLVLASGFVFAPVSNVLANVPILGSIYENFSSSVGYELFANDLVTSLNQKANSNGVDVTITSAYYDGNVIGITFKAEGKGLSIEHMDEGNRPVSGYSYHLFDGFDQNQWSSSGTELKETEDGFVGAVEFYNPDDQIPANFTLPLAFTHMADVNGTWEFDVPVEQIPSESIPAVYESTSTDGEYALKMETIIKGKATTMFEYKNIVPTIGKDDDIQIVIFDNNKNRLSKNHADLIEMNEENGMIEKSMRELFTSKIDEDASYLMVYPEIRKNEAEAIKSMDSSSPFKIKSKRFDYQITVSNVESNDNKLTVNYIIQNVNTDDFRKDIIQNFADFIKIIKTDEIKVDQHGELTNEMVELTVRSNQAKRINDDELHFESTFIIENPDEFDHKDYSLIVPFGTFSSNNPVKMEPIKIDLTKK